MLPSLRNRLVNRLREPFLACSHGFGVFLGIIGAIALLNICSDQASQICTILIYIFSFIAVFLASAMFHGFFHSNEAEEYFFEKLDYAAIYLFIAGSYTPICLLLLNNSLGHWILALEWGAALFGVYSTWRWGFARRGLQVAIFLFMGWGFVVASKSIWGGLTEQGLILLGVETMMYTIGAFIFAFAPRRIFQERICTHSIWHVMVLMGATSHFFVVRDIILFSAAVK